MKKTAFGYGFHLQLEYDETEKMIEEIMVVHNKESALEDILELCH